MLSIVTGAGGFVGRPLVEELRRLGRPVRALVHREAQVREFRDLGIDTVAGDVRDAGCVRSVLQGAGVVHHCAAGVAANYSDREIASINVEGVRNVLEALRENRSGRLVLVSSINVLGMGNLDGPAEDVPPRRSGDVRADAKVAAERLAMEYHQQHGVDVTIVRPPLVYGPGEHNIPKLLDAIRRGKFRFIGSPDNVVPLLHVSDLVQGMLLAAESPAARGRVYHLADGSRTTMRELVTLLAEMTGTPVPKKRLPYLVPRLACTVFEWLAKLGLRRKPPPINRVSLRFLGTSRFVNISRARQELGFEPRVEFREGMAAYVDWLKDHSHDRTAAADAASRGAAQ